MAKTKNNILAEYEKNVQVQQLIIDNLKSWLNKVSFLRLGAFISEILVAALIVNFGFFWLTGILAIIPVIGFLALVKKNVELENRLNYASRLLWIYQNEVDHITFKGNKYADGTLYNDESHPYASDLDITGPGSLFANINRCNTQEGLDLLAGNLLKPNDKTRIVQRQQAIAELTEHIDQTFNFRAHLQNHKPAQLTTLKNKLEYQLPQQLKFTEGWFIKFYTVAGPVLTLLLFLTGIFIGGPVWSVFGLVAVFNGALMFFHIRSINLVHNGFSGSSSLLNAFSETIKWQEDIEWKSTYIKDFFNTSVAGKNVSSQIKDLASIIRDFDARLNDMVGGFLNLFFVWDLRCSVRVAIWHENCSNDVIEGLSRISKFEELICFATLNYNQENWPFPEISDTVDLQTVEIGHPLIPSDVRVVNSFSLASPSTADIVTGSNMAGKSTFLRTIGINMVLAFSGAPVCARSFSLSIFQVLSYMRIKDSLNDQTSTFKAELNRLKMILDGTAQVSNSFVLIDEMLRGTNSKDKYLGSKVFIEKLIAQKTPVLFATHDLQLSDMQTDYPGEIRNYHFDIQISEGEMNFDYKLKHGPCKTFNAALLLKEIGLTLS